MKVEVRVAEGVVLEYLVALCEGWKPVYMNNVLMLQHYHPGAAHTPKCYPEDFNYSTDWTQGGPIIEREKLGWFWDSGNEQWCAANPKGTFCEDGPTPLNAAMRCYVTSKLGDVVEVPDELI